MASEGTTAVVAETTPHEADGKHTIERLPLKRRFMYVTKRTVTEFTRHQCLELAAALTFYSVLSLFPALLALTSLLGLIGEPDATATAVLRVLRQAGQTDIADLLEGPVTSLASASGAGLALAIGLVGALWASSKYVVGFSRAMNRIYGVEEGRPVWKLRPQMLLITIVMLLIAGLVILGIVLSGSFARNIGAVIGIGEQTFRIWNLAKGPVILLLVIMAVAILYYFTPNVDKERFRILTVGSSLAILALIIATVGFGIYVSSYSQFSATYGSLAGVIIFLFWLWLTNTVLLAGAELDAELTRSQQLQKGIAAEEFIQLPPRDTAASRRVEAMHRKIIDEGRRMRLDAMALAPAGAATAGAATAGAATAGATAADGSAETAEHLDVDTVDLEPLPSEIARLAGY